MFFLNRFPKVDPSGALVPGYFSTHIQLKRVPTVVRVVLVSTTSAIHMPHMQSSLILDIEPVSTDKVAAFYNWKESVYMDLKEKFVIKGTFPK